MEAAALFSAGTLPADLLAAATRVTRNTGLAAVEAARDLSRWTEEAMRDAVERARAAGATWQEIGDVLGASRQAAFQRFGRPLDPRTGAPMARTATPDAEARAVAVLVDLLAGRWDAARRDFDATMSAALPAGALADTMAQVAGLVGAYHGMGQPFVHQAGDLTLVRIPLRFEAGEMAGQVAFDRAGRIAGLHIMRPDAI